MLLAASLAVVLLLIVVNALYVAGEFAAVSVRPTRVQQRAEEGSALAARMLPFVSDPALLDRFVAACQIGITASSLILGAFGETAFAPPLAELIVKAVGIQKVTAYAVAAIIVLVLLTTLQMVLGELLPKAVALRFPLQTALLTVVPVAWSSRVLGPFIFLLNGSALLVLKPFGVKHEGHRHVHSPEELELILSESSISGVLTPDDVRRLHNALFLGKGTARQLMVSRNQVAAVALTTPWPKLIETVSQSPYTRFPVYGDSLDDVRGLVDTKTIVALALRPGQPPPLQSLLKPAVKVPGSTPADTLLGLFRAHRTQQLLVVSDQGVIEGLVTLEDALTELVGELADEFKTRRRRRRPAAQGADNQGMGT